MESITGVIVELIFPTRIGFFGVTKLTPFSEVERMSILFPK